MSPRHEKIVSIGGWCGVAAVLRQKTTLCQEAYPFDYILSSFEGVIHFLRNDFEGFFPETMTPRIEDGFTKFVGRHTIFLHHDLRKPAVVETFQRRIRRFMEMLARVDSPVLFVRASGPHFDETHLIPEFVAAIRERFPDLKFRLLFISHFHGEETKSLSTSGNVIVKYLDTEESREEEYLRACLKSLDQAR